MLVGCDTAPTMKNVAGEYKLKVDEHSFKAVLLDIGTIEIYYDGKPLGGGGTPWWFWSTKSPTVIFPFCADQCKTLIIL